MGDVTFVCLSAVILSCWLTVYGLVDPIPMPEILADCYRTKTRNISITAIPAQEINSHCVTVYLYRTSELRYQRPIANETILYAQELFRKLIGKHFPYRKKRQTGRLRREVRTLSQPEWLRFVGRLNQLKRETINLNGLSRYDSLADLHRFVTRSAHNGAAFLPWHRIYLLIMEVAIGLPIPYWDSRLDFHMEDPTDSVLWTPLFFGSGFGEVNTGPFARWVTPENIPLVRNIGNDGTLISSEGIQAVLSRSSHSEITEPNVDPQFSVEGHHNGPHVWVDGQLSAPMTAAQDPIFFMHHAFIDYVWSLFKTRQRELAINSEGDYPPNNDPLHQPFSRMFPFALRNIDGFSNYYDSIISYEPAPSCPDCGNSPYIVCISGQCVSNIGLSPVSASTGTTGDADVGISVATRNSVGGRERTIQTMARTGPLRIGPRFRSIFRDLRVRGDTVPNAPSSRSRRSANASQSIWPFNHQHLGRMDRPYQNTFLLDGVSDIKRWAFIPVRILYERQPEVKFQSYVVHNGKLVNSSDFYADSPEYKGLKVEVRQKVAATYPKCQTSGSGANKVFVQSDGIDYSGRYKDYAVVDERQPMSSSMTYIGVKNPEHGAAKVYLTSYDSCGRICVPQCLVNGKFQKCSGAFRITTEFPKMYGTTYFEAVKSVWDLQKQRIQTFYKKNAYAVPVTFVCEKHTHWPWVF